MDPWTVVVVGLVVLPVIGLVAVLADLVDAYRDFVIVSEYRPKNSIEYEQAKHTAWAQVARAASLVSIGLMAMSELLDVLTRNGTAWFVYAIAMILVLDAIRARRVRKRMVKIIQTQETP